MISERLLDRYQLEAELGHGGMGKVYRAQDTLLGREVAIKMLSSGDLGTEGPGRLLEEAQAAAQLNHPNIVGIYDVGQAEDGSFIVMELLEGETLRDHKVDSIEAAIRIARQLCAALEHAHAQGIVHRDLKPENVIISPNGTAKLTDFGLARPVASRLSREGLISGTVFYLAPELALGQAFDGRADLYALGVTLYELLTARLPFTADDPLAVISQHLYAPVVPPRAHRADIPPALDQLITSLLGKQPEARPASAAEVAAALDRLEFIGGDQVLPVAEVEDLPLLERLIRGRFIGRAGELKALRQRWAYAQEGNGQLVLISGEPGIGKSRLAREIIAYARLSGAYVLQGGSYEYETKLPYLPFVEALRDWVHSQPDEQLRQMLATTAVELAKLAPEIEDRLGPLEPNPALNPEEERLRLFDNVARFLQNLARQRGLLVFLDDLHWADQGSLTMLHYLLRRLQDNRVLILGAYREVELDRKHPLSAALVSWNRERLATRLQLSRFTQEECASLLATMFGQEEISAEFTEAIYRETEGNPFFIEEVAKALVDQGQIYLQNGDWERKAIDELAVPQSIMEAIGRRLDRLSEACVEALQSAAVLGKDFGFSELAAIVEMDEEQLLDLLDEAGRAQLVQIEPAERFVFTHDKIREVLYEELNPIRRRRLHRRIVDVFEALYEDHADKHASDLAYHAVLGGDLERGLVYSVQAAEKSSQVFAHEEALDYYRQARDCALALDDGERLLAIEEAIGNVHADRGHALLAVESFERALALAERREKKAFLKNRIGSAYTDIGDGRALDYLNSALDELDPESQRTEVAWSLAMIARNHHFRAQYGESIELLKRALELAEPSGDASALMNIYAFLAGSYQHLGRYAESNHWSQINISLGEKKDYPAATAVGHEFLSENATIAGDWERALHHAECNRQLGEKIGWLARIAWSGFAKLAAYRGSGNLPAAQAEGRENLKIAEDLSERRLMVWIGAYLAIVETDLEEDAAALELVERAVKLAEESGEPILISASHMAKGYYHVQRDEWEEARQVFEASEVIQAQRQSLGLLSQMWAVCAQALMGSGDLHAAAELVEALLAHTRRRGETYPEALTILVQGQIYTKQARFDEALGSFETAKEIFGRLGSQLELGRTHFHHGRLYETMGDEAQASQTFNQALEIFSEIGARRDAQKIEMRLVSK